MIDQLRSELFKLRSTRTSLVLLLAMIALVLLIVLSHGLTLDAFDLERADRQRPMLAIGALGAVFAALVGILGATSEFRHGTIRPTFLFTPRRHRVSGAKVAASLIMGLGFGLLAEGLAFGTANAVLAGRGSEIALGTGDLLLLFFGTTAMTALWAGLGAGVGLILRSQVGAVVALLVWLLVLETILFGVVPGVGRFAPGVASQALTGDPAEHLLPPLAGGLVLLVYVTVFAAAGAALTERRDV